MLFNRLRHFILYLSLGMFLITCNARAMIWADPADAIASVTDTVQIYVGQATMFIDETIKGTIGELKSMAKGFFAIFRKKEEAKVPGKDLQSSAIADIYNYHSVKPAIDKLFLEYPSDDVNIQLLYRSKAREFYDDTLIEAFTSVRELEKQYIKIDKKIAQTTKNYSDAQDQNEGLYNSFMIEAHIDELLRVLQELVAIKGQIYSASAILNKTDPLYYGEPGKGIQFITVEEDTGKKKQSLKDIIKEGKQVFDNAKDAKDSIDEMINIGKDMKNGNKEYMNKHGDEIDEAAEQLREWEDEALSSQEKYQDKFNRGKDKFNRVKNKIF